MEKVPTYIAVKLAGWIEAVGHHGLSCVRKISGYHDELLKGNRINQRSIRLNRVYRAIYEIQRDKLKFIEIVEVNKYEY